MIYAGIKKSKYGEFAKFEEVMQGEIDAEILIVGSSRALVHFDCEQIEAKLGKSCYNLGFDGVGYEPQSKLLELYQRKNNPPSEIIWVIDLNSFEVENELYGFEPLVIFSGEKEIKQMLNINKAIPSYLYYIPLIRFKFKETFKFRGILSFFGREFSQRSIKKGYREMDKTWDYKLDELLKSNTTKYQYILSKDLISDFEKNVNKLKSNGITVSVVFTPLHVDADLVIENKVEILSQIDSIASNLSLPYFNYANDSINLSREWFYNANHLNKNGVEFWMKIFLEDYEKYKNSDFSLYSNE